MATKTLIRIALAVVTAVPAAIVACGGGQTTTGTPQGGSASAASSSAAPPATSAAPSASAAATVAWKDMDHQARLAFMKNTVLPKMHDEFAAADPKKWGDIGCPTCHGDGAKAGTFKMPNAKLPVLPTTPDGFMKLAKEKPVAMTFMKDKVVPDMAAMLGEAPFDPATKQGFGCGECHTFKK